MCLWVPCCQELCEEHKNKDARSALITILPHKNTTPLYLKVKVFFYVFLSFFENRKNGLLILYFDTLMLQILVKIYSLQTVYFIFLFFKEICLK